MITVNKKMTKDENKCFSMVNKFVTNFLKSQTNIPEEVSTKVIEEWKAQSNLNKLKGSLKKNDRPSFPSRPKSEYIYFCRKVRPKIQEEMRKESGEKVDIHKVTCELGRRWQLFKQSPDPELQQQFAKLAEDDKKRYHTEKERMQKKPDKNNHLRSKYLYFCKEERDKDPKINLTKIAQLWAEQKNNEKLTERYEKAKREKENTIQESS